MKSILMVKLSALGDVIHALCVLDAFKETWPGACVDWVVGEAAAPLLKGHPMIRRLLVYRRRQLGRDVKNPLGWMRAIRELAALRREIRAVRYDAAVDLQGLFKSGMIMQMARADQKVGFAGGREFSSIFLNRKLPPYDPDRHAVDRYLDLARFLGAEGRQVRFPLGISQEDRKGASELLSRYGLEPGTYAVLVPGTVWPTKHWNSSGFSQVARKMLDAYGIRSLVVGSGSEADLAQAVSEGSRGAAVSIAGMTGLKELAAIFESSILAVSVDTGPMHMAVAAGTRVVALFGPTAPWRTGPYGQGHQVVRRPVSCSPCFKRRCPEPRCMEEITPEEVMEAVGRVLEKGRFPGAGGIKQEG